MNPEQQLWMLMINTNPQLANYISNAYTGQVNPLPYTNAIITGLGQLGIPITRQGIINAHTFARNTMNPQRRQFSDLNRDGVYGGLADFAKVMMDGARGIVWF